MAEVPMNFPSNSLKSRLQQAPEPETDPRPKLEKIVEGTVTPQKKTWTKRVLGMIIAEDARNLGPYILNDVLVPALKDMMFDMVQSAASKTFGVDIRRPTATSPTRFVSGQPSSNRQFVTPHTNYNAASRPAATRPPSGISPVAAAGFSFEDLAFEDRGQAERVLDRMQELVSEYEVVSVSELYDLVGISADFIHQKWGWFDLRGTQVTRSRSGGYILALPPIQSLTT